MLRRTLLSVILITLSLPSAADVIEIPVGDRATDQRLSRVLIKGGGPTFDVLFTTLPGGAGYDRREVQPDGRTLGQVRKDTLFKALEVISNTFSGESGLIKVNTRFSAVAGLVPFTVTTGSNDACPAGNGYQRSRVASRFQGCKDGTHPASNDMDIILDDVRYSWQSDWSLSPSSSEYHMGTVILHGVLRALTMNVRQVSSNGSPVDSTRVHHSLAFVVNAAGEHMYQDAGGVVSFVGSAQDLNGPLFFDVPGFTQFAELDTDGFGAQFESPLTGLVGPGAVTSVLRKDIENTPGIYAFPLSNMDIRIAEALGFRTNVPGGGITGSWFERTSSGQGFNIQLVDNDTAVIYMYTYDLAGNPFFTISVVNEALEFGVEYETSMFEVEGASWGNVSPDLTTEVTFGALRIQFDSCTEGNASVVNNRFNQDVHLTIERFAATQGVLCGVN